MRKGRCDQCDSKANWKGGITRQKMFQLTVITFKLKVFEGLSVLTCNTHLLQEYRTDACLCYFCLSS